MTPRKHAQAALEYMFTYGWAFLAILVTVGVMAYFGVFDFSSLKGPECVLPPGVVCEDYYLGPAAAPHPHAGQPVLLVDVRNALGTNIEVQSWNVSDRRTGGYACQYLDGVLLQNWPFVWNREASLTVSCRITDGYVRGQYYDFTLNASFNQVGESYMHLLRGWVSVTGQ